MKNTIIMLLFLIFVANKVQMQTPDYKSYIIEIKQWEDLLYEIQGTDLVIEFKSFINPKFTHSKFMWFETVKLTVYIFSFSGLSSVGGEVCWKEEKYEYNFYTDEYEYRTVYDDCYNIENIYRKVSSLDINLLDVKSVNSYGEITEVEYFLIPCDASCFND